MASHQRPTAPPIPPVPPIPPMPPAAPASSGEANSRAQNKIPYIGSRISLITKTDIRYESYLFNIDTTQNMIVFQNVRSFGTEGRRADHIPPSDTILPFATFKASEIKDLHVCEAAPTLPPVQTRSPIRSDTLPAMENVKSSTEVSYTSHSSAKTSTPIKKPEFTPFKNPSLLLTPGAAAAASRNHQDTQHVHSTHSESSASVKSARTIPGMGGHLLKRKERRVPGDDNSNSIPTVGDFNIEQALTGFDKEKEFEKLTVDEAQGSYQKSSFFDTISCDALDRLEGNRGRVSASDERRLNTETFGAVGLNNGRRNYRRGGRGGRGGRSGRGRGYGRGRGGNKNQHTEHRRNYNASQD
ncbi:unnamed protein product [Albugo candida]|uniref:DFDF domain-containing protein n=1 Tax=Albugo candida TaxID=65357 RepID=A0A024GBP7_9STRA|nr:unnamed protein product [Albugo candida]|eukprot:CCI43930.1 unnamed protein product [Albugo candida]